MIYRRRRIGFWATAPPLRGNGSFIVDFALAEEPRFRNLSSMRKLLFAMALLLIAVFQTRAADSQAVNTNSVTVKGQGKLEILTPQGWTLVNTNLQLQDGAPTVELHSVSNKTVIRLTVYWDGFGEKLSKPTEANMEKIVSNVVVSQYLPISVEKKYAPEKLKGKTVSGVFARITDAGWTPMVKDEYQYMATGMFRCENFWGYFYLLSGDKNGEQFNDGMKVMQS